MAVTMNLYLAGKNGSSRRFVGIMEASELAKKVREEEGNIRYEFYSAMDDSETVLLISSWESQEDLDRHRNSSRMKTITSYQEKYGVYMIREEKYVTEGISL